MPRFFVPRAELGENFLVLTGENAAHAFCNLIECI